MTGLDPISRISAPAMVLQLVHARLLNACVHSMRVVAVCRAQLEAVTVLQPRTSSWHTIELELQLVKVPGTTLNQMREY